MDPKDYRSYDTAIVTVLGSIYSSTISTIVFQTFFFIFALRVFHFLWPSSYVILLKKKSPTNSKHV